MYRLALTLILICAATAAASCPTETVPLEASLTSQNLTSPGYPQQYESNLQCRWQIRATRHIEVVVRVTVVILDLENSTDCQNDSLIISRGFHRQKRLANLCGNIEEPVSFLASGSMNLVFTTNSDSAGQGFVLQYIALLDVDEDGHEKEERSSSWGVVVIAVCVVVALVLILSVIIVVIKTRRNIPKQAKFDSPFNDELPKSSSTATS